MNTIILIPVVYVAILKVLPKLQRPLAVSVIKLYNYYFYFLLNSPPTMRFKCRGYEIGELERDKNVKNEHLTARKI